MIGKQQFRPIELVEQIKAFEKIRVAAQQLPGDDAGRRIGRPPAGEFAVKRALRRHHLLVKFGERQAGRHHRVLNVVKPIVAAGQNPLLGQPAFGPRIRRVDADIDDFGDVEPPFAHHAKALVVPIGVGDQVDRDDQSERAGEFERLEVAAGRGSLAVALEAVLVDRFEADKDVLQPEGLPETEHLFVAQQHVAAGFEVIALFDPGAGDRLAQFHRMALMDKGDVVDDKNPGLADPPQILDDMLGADQAIAAAVKRPGATKRAIPRAAAGKLDRRARVENADKVFAAMTQQVARRHHLVERMDKDRLRSRTGAGDRAGNRGDRGAGFERGEQERHRCLALALQHTVDRTRAVFDHRLGGERRAVPADADKNLGEARLGRLGEIDELGHVRQVIAAKRDDIRAPARQRAEIGALAFDLKVEQAHRVAGLPRRRGDEFEPDRFEPQKDLRIGQWAGMDAEHPHCSFPSIRHARPALGRGERLSRQL